MCVKRPPGSDTGAVCMPPPQPLQPDRESNGGSMMGGRCCACCGSCCAGAAVEPPDIEPLLHVFARRIPWLVSLMLIQSVSSFVLQRYEDLIENNVIIASYLTMLVGGGGNAAVQVVTDLVRRHTRAQHDETGWVGKNMGGLKTRFF